MFPNKRIGSLIKLLITSLMVVGFATTISAADLKPVIAKGKGDTCVGDKDFMRLNHMDLLSHARDKTMRQGDRNTTYSLKKCINCHAVNGPDGTVLTVASPNHFCRSCHDFAAVSMDCFQCHTSKPELKNSTVTNSHLKLPEMEKTTEDKKE